MRRHVLALLIAALPFAAHAQTAAQQGAADGAAAGGAALGAVGAAVGSITGAAVGGAADIAHAATAPLAPEPPPPTTVRRSTCVTDVAGNKRCDTVETTN